MFDKDDRVLTPLGTGTIVYRRMAAPNYSEAETYSVRLDKPAYVLNSNYQPNYAGTIFLASQVKELS